MKVIDLNKILQLDLQRELIGRQVTILGSSRQGKTNTAAVLGMELLAAGVPLTIIDFKGEYHALKNLHQIQIIGQVSQADLRAGPEQASALAALSVAESISLLIDLSSTLR